MAHYVEIKKRYKNMHNMRKEIIKENCFIGWYVFVGGGGVNSNNTKNKVELKICTCKNQKGELW